MELTQIIISAISAIAVVLSVLHLAKQIKTASTLLTSLRLKTTGTLSPTLECLKENFFN